MEDIMIIRSSFMRRIISQIINNALKKKPRTIRITPAIEKEMTITVSDIQLINKTAQDPKLKENAGIK